ncbi:MAG: GNAT family N-acetyltransferase [Candidatus Fimadaptatus sp.]|jgi:GNAT superfamily N-acetyltransferase
MEIRLARASDRARWFELDAHLPEDEFMGKLLSDMLYAATVEGRIVGVLRWGLFWDSIPFMNLLYVDEALRGQGCGRALVMRWERDMRARGYGMVLTSTQVDEQAQQFYRHMGYRDCGGLIMELPGYEQPMEMFMCKPLGE